MQKIIRLHDGLFPSLQPDSHTITYVLSEARYLEFDGMINYPGI